MNKIKDAFIKLLSNLLSRRIAIYFVNKILAFKLIYMLVEPMYISIVFLISTVFDLFVIQEINIKPIDAKIDITKQI